MKKKADKYEATLENLRSIADPRGYRVDETEEYFELYSQTNPFPSLIVWKDDFDCVTVKARIDDDDLFFEEQFNGFDNALTAFILLDKTTKAIGEQVRKNVVDLFGKHIYRS